MTQTVRVSGGVVPHSRTQALPPGLYSYSAAYSGDSNYLGATGSCESLSITIASPTIGTTVNPSGTINYGQSASDTATLTGAYSPSGSITFTLYSNSACTTSVYTSTNAISGSSATSGSYTPTATGTYYWKASYPGDSNNNGVTSVCGPTGETLTVQKHVTMVQDVQGVAETSSSFTCSFNNQPAVGDLIVVSFSYTPSTLTVSSVKDHASNLLTVVNTATESSSAATIKAAMYEEIVPSGDATSSPITVTLSNTPTSAIVTCVEFSGVLSGTAVRTATNQGTTTSASLSMGLASSISPNSNDLVYAYTGFTFCVSSNSHNVPDLTTSSPFGAGSGTITGAGSSPDASVACTSSHDYKFNDGDQYITSWSGVSTTASFTACGSGSTDCVAPSGGDGSLGWVEIVVEFDPPAPGSPSNGSASQSSQAASFQVLPIAVLLLCSFAIPVGVLTCAWETRTARERTLGGKRSSSAVRGSGGVRC